jgi:hypothetical protein
MIEMQTTDQPVLPDNSKPTENSSSSFMFDATLSTAVASNGAVEVKVAEPAGPLAPEMLDKMNR